MDMDAFKYQPIDLDRPAVRLVRLLKGNVADGIHCELFEGWIDQFEGGIPYEALSYTWGSTEKSAMIEVNGSTMHVTANLFEALQHLRSKDEDRILWIDAICIDQDNPHERTHQVRQMGHMYKEAEEVLIWLGQGTEETDFVMDSIERLHKNNAKVGGDWRRLAHHWMDHRAVLQSNMDDRNSWREGLDLILKQPWFSRVWILQEIANARVAKVICGKKTVSARTFAQFPPLIGITPDPHCQAILDIMPGLSRKESWWSEKRDLHTLLVKFRRSLATDERDIVYALLGVSSDACSSDILQPDYTKPTKQVIRDTVSFLLPEMNQDGSFYKFLDWKMSEFLQNLESLNVAVCRSAVENGDEAAVNILLAIDSGQAHRLEMTAKIVLNQEISEGNEAAVKLLVENGIELETKDDYGQTSLMLAARSSNEAIVQLLIEYGAEIEAKHDDGLTPLMLAVQGGNRAIIKLLIEKGAEIEAKDSEGRTPLMLAIHYGKETLTQLLIEKSAKIEAKDSKGWTPLMLAVQGKNRDIVQLLLEKGAEIEAKDNHGRTSLLLAVRNNDIATAELLIERGAQMEAKDSNGRTPLMVAIQGENGDIVQLLLEKGAEIEAKDNNGQTPLMVAVQEEIRESVQLLLEKGAKIEAKDSEGRTPLMVAVRNNDKATAELLIERGAEIEAKDYDGQSPLSQAAMAKNMAMVYLLQRELSLRQRITTDEHHYSGQS